MNSPRVRAANAASKRITISSATPSEAIRSALTGSGVSSRGMCAGAITADGMGLEGEHGVGVADHVAVADVHAVEGADRDRARGPGAASVSSVRRIARSLVGAERRWPRRGAPRSRAARRIAGRAYTR